MPALAPMIEKTDMLDAAAPALGLDVTVEEGDRMPSALTLSEEQPLSDAALELSTLPLVLLDSRLEAARADLEGAEDRLSTARITYGHMTRAANFLTPAEAEAQRVKHLPLLVEAERAAAEAADVVGLLARNAAAACATDREPALSDADMQRASARQVFVKEDCEELPMPDLAAKIRHALQARDAALSFLYLRYGARRLQQKPLAGGADQAAREEVTTLLRSVRDRLIDTRPQETAVRAKELQKAAMDLRRDAGTRAAEAFVAQAPGRGRYSAL